MKLKITKVFLVLLFVWGIIALLNNFTNGHDAGKKTSEVRDETEISINYLKKLSINPDDYILIEDETILRDYGGTKEILTGNYENFTIENINSFVNDKENYYEPRKLIEKFGVPDYFSIQIEGEDIFSDFTWYKEKNSNDQLIHASIVDTVEGENSYIRLIGNPSNSKVRENQLFLDKKGYVKNAE
ncbi:hypothetical protein JEQ21_09070 [Streptococcus sp. 121]|uniref:hypothetical protein n=1 Tax=Streptococcus sp. 121 TaxID=2797637 RepID=UPI0018F10275|nr:hypothetical protein [Streptococcus sp. 121]MBJ6746588.1 hypothetical protein [Streptococcus sp. 121]